MCRRFGHHLLCHTPMSFPTIPLHSFAAFFSMLGCRYLDTGEEIPDVPRDCIRVLTLTPGMKVEARYGGGLDFYPGTIDGINSR